MKLSEIIKDCNDLLPASVLDNLATDPDILSVTSDSRKVTPGTLFIAVQGEKADGHDYMTQAVKNGASAIIAQKNPDKLENTIIVDNTRSLMGPVASSFYGNPSGQLVVTGVTGTNGKTTITWLLEHIFNACGFNTGVIGTINIRYNNLSIDNGMTTPDAIDLQQTLHQMQAADVTHVIMEVSSHGLSLNRVDGCSFDTGIFTNLTQDHLDFHKDMDEYFAAKKRLFTDFLGPASAKKGKAVLNMDDPRGQELFDTLGYKCIGISTSRQEDIFASQTMDTIQGLSGTINLPQTSFTLSSPLTGRFNLENILCAAGAAHALKIQSKLIKQGLESCMSVPGRLEKVENTIDRHIFVDYAHTPDALESILTTLEQRAPKRLITVFGCGGDRDSSKRPLMGEIAARLSDISIVTSDNPRTENPDAIIKDILKGMQDYEQISEQDLTNTPFKKGYLVETEREQALETAVRLSKPGDIIVAAGKGHETYQITNNGTIHFDDREVLRSAAENFAALFTPIGWSMEDLTNALETQPVTFSRKTDHFFDTINTDSRIIGENELFLALEGENFDGHDFIPSLIEKGIKGFVVRKNFSQELEKFTNQEISESDIIVFETGNTLSALGQLARYQRERADVKVVAITGSSGKTTTRKITQQIFQTYFHTHSTLKNFNNEIGVPQTLLALSKSHEWAIIEMGMNHAGEIERLSKIARPDIAVITNTAGVHLEGLGTVENVAKAKAEIFKDVKKDSTAILFAKDQNLSILAKAASKCKNIDKTIFFGTNCDTNIHGEIIEADQNRTRFTVFDQNKKFEVSINSPARFMVDNCLAAIGAASIAGIDIMSIQKGIQSFTPESGRMNIYSLAEGIELIDDAYNANPASVASAIETLSQLSRNTTGIAVLGDMLELGTQAEQLHYKVGQQAYKAGINKLYLFGEMSASTRQGAVDSGFAEKDILHSTKEKIIQDLLKTIKKGTWVLVKGSRGMAMESIIQDLKNNITNTLSGD